MRRRDKKEKFQTLPYSEGPKMIPFTVERPENPSPEQVDQIFANLIKDLDYDALKMKKCSKFSTEDKMNVILSQEENEKKVPAPEWLIEAINNHPSDKLLQTCNINLKTARLCWVHQFCQSGGHILLIKQLAMMTAYQQLFEKSFPTPHERIMNLLSTIHFLVDCKHGSQQVLNFKEAVNIITNAINPKNLDQFDSALYILLPYVFSPDGPKSVISSLQKLASNLGENHTFDIFTQAIQEKPLEIQHTIIPSFVNGLYSTISSNFVERIKLDFEFRDSSLITALNDLSPEIKKSFSPWLDSFLSSVDSDFKEISSLFDGTPSLILQASDIVKELPLSKDIKSFLISLFSLSRNAPDSMTIVSSYLSRFLVAFRSCIKHVDVHQSINRAHEYAISDDQTLEQSKNVETENSFYRLLNERFDFIADFDLPEINTKPPDPNESTKTEIDTDELSALKAELDHEKAENEKLRTERAKLIDIVQSIPTKPIEHSAIEADQIFSGPKADFSVGLGLLSSIKSMIPQDTYDSLEKVLTDAQSEQIRIMKNVRNIIQQNKLTREAEKADYQRISSLKKTIISQDQPEIQGNENSSSDDESDSEDEFKFQSRDPRTNLVRMFPWEETLPNQYFKKVKKHTSPQIKKDEGFFERFSVIIPENQILSDNSEKKFANILKMTRLDPQILAEGIRNGKVSITQSTLIKLSKLPEIRAEVMAARQFSGDISQLRDGEKLAVSLEQIPNWRSMVRTLLDHHHFDESMTILAQKVEKFSNTINYLTKSEKLKGILSFVLSFINTLNGEFRSSFSISDLCRLKTFKINKSNGQPKETLLSIIVDTIKTQKPDLLEGLSNEIFTISDAAKIDITQLEGALRNAQRILSSRERSLFNMTSSKRILDELNHISETYTNYTKLSQSLGVRERWMKPESLIPIIIEFYSDILTVLKGKNVSKTDAKEDVQQRGVLDSMVGALKKMDAGTSRATYSAENDVETDYMRAYTKVRHRPAPH